MTGRVRKYRVAVIAAGCFAAVAAMCAGLNFWTSPSRMKSAGEYERQIAAWPRELVRDFPVRVPAGATSVRVFSDTPSLMPSPSHFIQLRFIGSPADVQSAIAAGERGEARTSGPAGWDPRRGAEASPVIDDGDPSTPLSSAYRCYSLVQQGVDYAGVAVNPETGEIVYWATMN